MENPEINKNQLQLPHFYQYCKVVPFPKPVEEEIAEHLELWVQPDNVIPLFPPPEAA